MYLVHKFVVANRQLLHSSILLYSFLLKIKYFILQSRLKRRIASKTLNKSLTKVKDFTKVETFCISSFSEEMQSKWLGGIVYFYFVCLDEDNFQSYVV